MTGFDIHLRSKGLAPNTVRLTLSRVEKILSECSPLNLETFEQFIVKLFETVSESAVNKYIQALKLYGKYKRLNWTEDIRQVKEQSKPRVLLSDSEIEQIINTKPPPDRLSVFWATIAFTGARPTEIATLTRSDIDLESKLIYITATKTKTTRTIPISDILQPILEDYLPTVPKDLLFYVKGKPDKPMYSDQLRANFKERLKICCIRKKVTPYSLRHSFITRILDNEANLFAVQGIVGHKKANTTQEYYKGSLKAMRKAASRDPMNQSVLTPQQALQRVAEELQKSGIFENEGITYQLSKNKIVIEIEPKRCNSENNEYSLAKVRTSLG